MMTSKWIIKAIVQKVISYLPGSERINYFFQKYVTGGVRLTDEYFGQKLQHAGEHYRVLRKYGHADPGNIILELGTGWYPIIPLWFFLTGSGRVYSIDIKQWMTRETQQMTLQKMHEWRERGLLDELVTDIDPECWGMMMDIIREPDAFDQCRVNRVIGLDILIQDAGSLDMKEGSVDFICSNNTFEHIPESKLREILNEFNRVLKPGGSMSHFIDMTDHFAHFDHRISIYNFLKFSDRKWNFLDNRIQPQNRLRFTDYKQLYREAGIAVTEEIVREGDPDLLRKLRIHSRYSGYDVKELAISHGTLITKKQVPENMV